MTATAVYLVLLLFVAEKALSYTNASLSAKSIREEMKAGLLDAVQELTILGDELEDVTPPQLSLFYEPHIENPVGSGRIPGQSLVRRPKGTKFTKDRFFYCRKTERQVTTVDGNQARICCIGSNSNQQRMCHIKPCSRIINRCCVPAGQGNRVICTGMMGGASPGGGGGGGGGGSGMCKKTEKIYATMNQRSSSARMCCINRQNQERFCQHYPCASFISGCCMSATTGNRICTGWIAQNEPTGSGPGDSDQPPPQPPAPPPEQPSNGGPPQNPDDNNQDFQQQGQQQGQQQNGDGGNQQQQQQQQEQSSRIPPPGPPEGPPEGPPPEPSNLCPVTREMTVLRRFQELTRDFQALAQQMTRTRNREIQAQSQTQTRISPGERDRSQQSEQGSISQPIGAIVTGLSVVPNQIANALRSLTKAISPH